MIVLLRRLVDRESAFNVTASRDESIGNGRGDSLPQGGARRLVARELRFAGLDLRPGRSARRAKKTRSVSSTDMRVVITG